MGKIVKDKYPELSAEDQEAVRQHAIAALTLTQQAKKAGLEGGDNDDEPTANTALLEGVRSRQPGMIEELIPAILSVSDVQRVLQNLLGEDVSIRNIDQIAETLVDAGRSTKDTAELTEFVRQRLSHGICQGLRGRNPQLSVLSLDPRVEGQISENLKRGDKTSAFAIEPRLAEQLIRKLIPLADSMMRQRLAPVLLCNADIRRQLKVFTKRSVPKLAVLSVNEIPHTIDLKSFSVVKMD